MGLALALALVEAIPFFFVVVDAMGFAFDMASRVSKDEARRSCFLSRLFNKYSCSELPSAEPAAFEKLC